VKQDLSSKQNEMDKGKAMTISQSLEEMMHDINALVNENLMLKES